MQYVFVLLMVQIALGACDTLWHHEITEALPTKRSARLEVALHALRELLYAALFVAIAWWTWHGAWAALITAVLVAEVATTLADFVVEDATRRLPKLERILHSVLAINFGGLLALFVPILITWSALPPAIVRADYGAWSWFLSVAAVGVFAWGVRDAAAAMRLYRARSWQRIAPTQIGRKDAKTVLITGATGFIGRQLAYRLIERGDNVIALTRSRDKGEELFGTYAEVITDLDALDANREIDAIVNLAGAPVAGALWTRRRKRKLLESRLAVTRALLELVGRASRKPTTWINASAVGYYGIGTGDTRLHEKSASQALFQSELCRTWEATAAEAGAHGVKVAALRIGLVLGRGGGALLALARPVRFGLGACFGRGEQWVSWIHLDDLIDLALFVLEQETLAGPLNATAPTPVRHAELMRSIAATLHRPLLPFHVPRALLRAALGELAQLFVDGQCVVPDRAIALGFRFKYPTIDAALEQALGVSRAALDAHEGSSPSRHPDYRLHAPSERSVSRG